MTPAKFSVMTESVCRRRRNEDYRFGILTCIVERVAGSKTAQPLDHFPWSKPETVKPQGNTLAARVRANMRGYIAGQEEQKKQKANGG